MRPSDNTDSVLPIQFAYLIKMNLEYGDRLKPRQFYLPSLS